MFLQDCKLSVQQQGSEFVLNDGFDVIFSLLQEYHKSATTDMKQLGEHNGVRGYNTMKVNLNPPKSLTIFCGDKRASFLWDCRLWVWCDVGAVCPGPGRNSSASPRSS